jgi:DGQHR domain-containing protein
MAQDSFQFTETKPIRFSFTCIKARQPIGDLYFGVLPFNVLCAIADFDVRRIMQEERDVERYLGIQRPLQYKRVREIAEYVNFSDASFPSSIIIAVDERAATYDSGSNKMTLSNVLDPDDPILARNIARVIDGQHRIAGLYSFRGTEFDCPVTVLVGMDISDQGLMFARVNLSQTRVNPSLALDLFDLVKAPSPQKTCHEVTIRLDRSKDGPFFRRIKRLGVATEGRKGELLTQATLVKGLMPFISSTPDRDRDILLRGGPLAKAEGNDVDRILLRDLFIDSNDDEIFRIVDNYFRAIRLKWPLSWSDETRGNILPRTNGFLALMRFMRDVIHGLRLVRKPLNEANFSQVFGEISLPDGSFTTEHYDPGTSGEAKLYRELKEALIAKNQPLPL